MRFATLVLVAFMASGCGTIINGSNQDVAFNSSPTGARVTVDGLQMGTTPTVIGLSRKDSHTVEFSLDGYENQSMIINRSVSGWVWGNLVFGGLVVSEWQPAVSIRRLVARQAAIRAAGR